MNIKSNILETLNQHQGAQCPGVETKIINGCTYKCVPFVIEQGDCYCSWTYIELKNCNYHYRGLVNAIIELKYDLSETLSILFNYMDDPENEKYKNEYLEFQSWRRDAKTFARTHFGVE